MQFIEILLLAIGLSMDSLAVSVAGGAMMRSCKLCNMLKVGAVLGIFQAGMTVIGYLAGIGFEKYICAFDHWIAFVLLFYLGAKMIYDSFKNDDENENPDSNPLNLRTLTGLGIATSIDALAVGISLAILKSAIVIQALTIGLVTFAISAFGVYFGSRFGNKVNLRIEIVGGLILIGIGTKILIEHTLMGS